MNAPRQRPFVVPVFLPQAGCPYQCAFCNQAAITGHTVKRPSAQAVRQTIETFLAYGGSPRGPVQIAFYGGNFLGQAPERITMLLQVAADFVADGRADGIRFSTRPDTVDTRRLTLLEPYPVTVVELGVQSLNNDVLRLNRRGHDAAAVRRAVALVAGHGYSLGLQMMVGLAGENPAGTLDSGRAIASLNPGFVRIYPTLVLEGSRLARWYRQGKYHPLSLDAAVSQVKDLFLLFHRHGIRVVRLGLQSSPSLDAGTDLVAGPYHPAFGHLVHSRIFRDALLDGLAAAQVHAAASVEVRVHPAAIPVLRGLHNDNVRLVEKKYGPGTVRIVADESVGRRELVVDGRMLRPYSGKGAKAQRQKAEGIRATHFPGKRTITRRSF